MNEVIPFGDLAELRRETVDPSEVPELPYVGLEHISPDALYVREYGDASDVSSIKTRFHRNDILYGKLRPYFRKVAFMDREGISSTDIWVVKARSGIRPRYLFHLMSTRAFTAQSMASAKGTRMPRASWDFVSRWEVPARSVDEQDEVLSVLDPLDELAEANRAVATLAESLITAHSSRLDAVLPHVPLGDLAVLQRTSVKREDISESTIDLFSIPSFDKNMLPERIAPSDLGSNKNLVEPPALLLSRLNPRIPRLWPVPTSSGVASLCSTEFAVLVPTGSLPMGSLVLACSNRRFWRELRGRVTGTSGSHQRVKPDDLMGVPVPDLREAERSVIEEVSAIVDMVAEKRRASGWLARLRDRYLVGLADGSEVPSLVPQESSS